MAREVVGWASATEVEERGKCKRGGPTPSGPAWIRTTMSRLTQRTLILGPLMISPI